MVIQSGFGQIMKEADDLGFFKILRKEDISSEITRMIPHNLIQSICESSFKMVLKVPWGRSWPVKISKNPRFHYMEDHGWNKFVKDNALGANEYLTFTQEANMCFNVSIYEADGIEMLKPRKSGTIASSFGRNKNTEKDEMKDETESFTESRYPGRRFKKKRKLNLGKNKDQEAETSRKKKKDDNYEASTLTGVPEFTITIKPSYLLFLAIPKKFVMHMPNETTMFKIHHSKGKKTWKVTYLVTDAQLRFSAGWGRLTRDLDLQVGDVCTFKLIKPREMLLKISE